jgi:hypothetical protein
VTDFCKHSNEPSGSINGWEVDFLSRQALKVSQLFRLLVNVTNSDGRHDATGTPSDGTLCVV